MISVIICSRYELIDSDLKENIEKTIGVKFELIIINNSQNKYSIFEAYNLGIKQSKGEYLCFIHDDIFIHTNDWGKIISDTFEENNTVGLIGVAGSKVKTKMPSGWWNCPDDQKVINIIQHVKNDPEKWEYGFKTNDEKVEVIAVDGVFMAARKDERIFFNTKLKGFHNYDLNFSFEYKKYDYKVLVTNQILIEHFSIGNLDEKWIDSTFKIHSIYRKYLPLKIDNQFTNKDLQILEFDNGSNFINRSLNLGIKKNVISIWFNLFCMKPYSPLYSKFFKKWIKLIIRKKSTL
ncbi:glycosyltransferase [uncultured Flavobacterium sp.]|uniref:glycosyltransferase n=1 Tax=uncultured Flavobacterium sp. TaxID=165435 RepID=UPI00308169EF